MERKVDVIGIGIMTKKLSGLLQSLKEKEVRNFQEKEILGISADSRSVAEDYLFVALKGTRFDGHAYIDAAREKGATVLVTEVPVHIGDVTNVIVEDTAKALALLSARFFGNPAASLVNCGITGTNGKTSTAHMLRSIAETAKWGKMGIIGTIGHGTGKALEKASHTTPDPVTLHRLLREMNDKDCRGVVMEVSSHAVRQQRTWGIDFDVGILTNVTRDHLDYHSDLEDYIAAKREFCESLAGPPHQRRSGTLVYSQENPIARTIGESFAGAKISVGTDQSAAVFTSDIDASLDGTRFNLHLPVGSTVPVELQLLGRFNISNAALAAGAAHVLGIAPQEIKRGLEALPRVPGRFETLGGGRFPLIVIDYCHTPDSVEMTLSFCLDLKPKRLTTVFGCGGDRDRGKRPLMGRVAQELSHVCYVTEDNPRGEPLKQIFEDILSGMNRKSKTLHIVSDRSKAIQQAVAQSDAGDIIAIIGKGHEDYQIVGPNRFYFNDREEAKQALSRWKNQ